MHLRRSKLAMMAAVERQPGDAVAVDIHAADTEAGQRDLVDLGQGRIGRVRPRRQAHDVARMGQARAPDRAIGRRPGDRVHAVGDACVLGRVDRLARLVPGRGALAVADGIDDQRRPALRFRRVAGLPEQLGVDPADDGHLRHGGAAETGIVAEPQRVVGVFGEIQVMRAEASIDRREFLGLRIVDRDLARVLEEPVVRHVKRIELGRAQR